MTYINRAVTIAQNPTANLAATEKKTPELSPSSNNNNRPVVETSSKPPVAPTTSIVREESPAYQVPNSSSEAAKSSTAEDEKKVVPNAEPKTIPTEQVSKTGLRKSSKFGMPVMGMGNLDAMLEQAAAEKTEEVSLEPLNIDELKGVWDNYVKNIEVNSVRNVLTNAGLELEGEKVVVLVGSKFAENGIRQEKGLMPHLRKVLRRPNLLLSIKIDKSRALVQSGPARKKPDTPQDKYMKMKAINPLVEDIRRKFSLKLDEN